MKRRMNGFLAVAQVGHGRPVIRRRVIGAALVSGGEGIGHRRWRPVWACRRATVRSVRSWLRRIQQNAHATYRLAVESVVALNQDLLPATPPNAHSVTLCVVTWNSGPSDACFRGSAWVSDEDGYVRIDDADVPCRRGRAVALRRRLHLR